MSSLKPSRLNKFLGGLFCLSLWRKGALCCSVNCSCFNDIESPEAEQHRAEIARWNYRSEKMAMREESKKRADERRSNREEGKKQRRSRKTSNSSTPRQIHGKNVSRAENQSELPGGLEEASPLRSSLDPQHASSSSENATDALSKATKKSTKKMRRSQRRQEKEQKRAVKHSGV